ncbi:MAG: mannose-1-phosphate guanylyltransferase [Parcubacteria bacterium C7867-008]|nr:MAG: mannose-1-phosphate guanylyltransferase [Parcubacteria bacterium C7867-008]
MSHIQGIIQAGGKGTRLHPITLEIPKPLLTIGRRPILQHLVDLYRKNGVGTIHVIVNHDDLPLFERWEEEYKNGDIQFVVEETRLGTWGGIRKYLGHLDSTFLVSNGDELKDMDIALLLDTHKKKGAKVTLATVEVENPGNYGVVESNPDGIIHTYRYRPQNPASNFIMAGIYAAEPSLFAYEPNEKDGFISFEEDILPLVINDKALYECQAPGRWNDCGTFERYEQAIYDWTGKTKL